MFPYKEVTGQFKEVIRINPLYADVKMAGVADGWAVTDDPPLHPTCMPPHPSESLSPQVSSQ